MPATDGSASAGAELFPAVVALYGSGGGVQGMDKYAALLAAQEFAVYALHYFDRMDTKTADKATILRNFAIRMKTLCDAVSLAERQPTVDRELFSGETPVQ